MAKTHQGFFIIYNRKEDFFLSFSGVIHLNKIDLFFTKSIKIPSKNKDF